MRGGAPLRKRNIAKLSLHIPDAPARPAEKPNFSYLGLLLKNSPSGSCAKYV
jgi:hypothetical protein